MLVILEGPDCAGKTSLANALHAELERRDRDATVLRLSSGPPKGHPLDEYVVPLLGYRPNDDTNTHVICDRLHWGEWIYPSIFHRPSQLNHWNWAYIESFLTVRGAYVVHVTAPHDELEARMRVRGDDAVRPDQLAVIARRFFRVQERSTLPLLTTTVTAPNLVDTIIHYAGQIAETYRPLNRFTTYVGPRSPRRLLLGDVRGPMFQTGDPIDKLRTAFMPYPTTSGAYLWQALTRVDVDGMDFIEPDGRPHVHIGVANACDVDDPIELWRALGQPPTMTLGRNAQHTFPPGDFAPHPQWVRRFQHSRIDDYHDQLVGSREVAWSFN